MSHNPFVIVFFLSVPQFPLRNVITTYKCYVIVSILPIRKSQNGYVMT